MTAVNKSLFFNCQTQHLLANWQKKKKEKKKSGSCYLVNKISFLEFKVSVTFSFFMSAYLSI